MRPDSSQYYGTVNRLLHWLMVTGFVNILITIALWTIYDDKEWADALFGIHKPINFILPVLIVLRLLRTAMSTCRRPPADSVAAKFGHLALYMLMLAIPATGTIHQYDSGRGPLKVLGIQVVQGSPEKIERMADLGNMVHGNLGWLMFALVTGHIVMVVVHHA